MSKTDPSTVTTWAIETVARGVLANAVETPVEWENYPEIGEGDWERVLAEVRQLAAHPSATDYDSAYQHLAERAEGEPA